MNIPSLPVETQTHIAGYLLDKSDLLNLLIANSTFLNICRRIIYRRIKFSYRPGNNRALVRWSRSIITNSRLGCYVQTFDLLGFDVSFPGYLRNLLCAPVVKALGFLKNLKVLRVRCDWITCNPSLRFPSLEELSGPGTSEEDLNFLERHTHIKRLHLWGNSAGTSLNEPQEGLSRILHMPGLECYSGPLIYLQHIAPTTLLETVIINEYYDDVTLGLLALLKQYGSSFRTLGLGLSKWGSGLFAQIAENAPHLETLLVDRHYCGVSDEFFNDVAKLNSKTATSITVLLLPGDSFSSTVDDWPSKLHLLHKACPNVRFACFSMAYDDQELNEIWRYDGSKQFSIPPLSQNGWWRDEAAALGVTAGDYRALEAPSRVTGGAHSNWFLQSLY